MNNTTVQNKFQKPKVYVFIIRTSATILLKRDQNHINDPTMSIPSILKTTSHLCIDVYTLQGFIQSGGGAPGFPPPLLQKFEIMIA